MTDGELLRRYVRDRSETSFEELVRRHIDLIYSAALRQVNNDAHLAEDIVQAVFTDLARKARQLTSHPSLTGWLYTSTRFTAANLRRTEQRRTHREQEAFAMNDLLQSTGPEPDWARIRPLLDEAMHKLDDQDRQAVLMRHFEKMSFAEIGASIGLSESAARMRVQRALEKLQGTLAKHGLTSTAAALAGLLTVNAVGAAPAHLAAKVAGAALAGAATAGGVAASLSHLFALSKTKLALGAATILVATGLTLAVTSHHARAGNSDKPAVTDAPAIASQLVSVTNNPVAQVTNVPVVASIPVKTKVTNGLVLHLQIITSDTGRPIPMVPIEYFGQAGGKYKRKQIMSDRFGICDVVYPANTTELRLTTQKDDFADTRLMWNPSNGDGIPTNYVLRIDRPVAIGGLVVDADGNPVAGALVGWNHNDDPAGLKLPQNHEFSWIETATGPDGHWRINRMAEDMIPRIYGSASDTNYVDSGMVNGGLDKSVEQQLRAGTYVFKLGRAVTVKGLVTDAEGMPIPNAKILVGYSIMSDRRNGRSGGDGTFTVRGCPPGPHLVTAQAPGFAPTTMEVNLADNAEPVRLVLKPGKTLRLRVEDHAGNPIPHAMLWYDNMDQGMIEPDRPKSVQLDFNPTTDREGRVSLENAPDAEMKFVASAPHFLRKTGIIIRPDNEEHIITLSQALVVHGIVWDQATGNRIPQFRIALGWPEWDPVAGTTNAAWSTIGRFWLDFRGGTYSKSLEEPVISGTVNRGYILKFIAEGYAPFISRIIGPDEGDVELNVSLQRAQAVTVTVYKPDGRPAADADIGLVFPGSKLALVQGGFSRQNVQTGGSLLRTDAQGTFHLQPDDSVTQVIAAAPAGYAEVTPAELRANPVLQLQPWGRLEVSYVMAGKPMADRSYLLDFGGGSRDSIAFGFDMSQVTTDAQGRFSMTQMPPGHHNLMRIYRYKTATSGGWMNGDKTPFEIRPGETTTLDLAASNHTVTATVEWPAGLSRQPVANMSITLHTTTSAFPPEIGTNKQARLAYMQTAEFKAARQNQRSYQGTVTADDTLTVDGVKPGDYTLAVYVSDTPNTFPSFSADRVRPRKGLARGSVKVTVPDDPSAGYVDVGPVKLEKIPDPRF